MKFLLGVLTIFSFVTNADVGQCLRVYDPPRGLEHTVLAASGKETKLEAVSISYKVPILNQGRRGFCWLYSTYENLVNRFIQRNGVDPDISLHHLSYYHWLANAIKTATSLTGSSVAEGGNMDIALSLMRKHGVLTNKQYADFGGSTSVQLPSQNALEIPQLTGLVQKAHLDKSVLTKWLKPNFSYNSARTDVVEYYKKLYDDPTQKELMRAFIIRKSKQIKSGHSSLNSHMLETLKAGLDSKFNPIQALSGDQIDAFILALDKDIEADVTQFFNRVYFNSARNPVEDNPELVAAAKIRAIEQFPEISAPTIYFTVSNDRNQKPEVVETDDNAIAIALSTSDIKKAIRALHRQGTAVSLIYDHQGNYANINDDVVPEKDGLMSVKRMKFWPVDPYLTRRERSVNEVNYERGGHLVLTTGTVSYVGEKDSNKSIAGFQIANSWGTDVGKNGFFYMDQSYFGAFFDAANLFHADVIGNPEILKILGDDLATKLVGGIEILKAEYQKKVELKKIQPGKKSLLIFN